MKRVFSTCTKLLKSDSDGLKSTIKFLANGPRPLRGILQSADEVQQDDQQHEQRILQLLNKGLPKVEVEKQKVEKHYDVLFRQLKNIVERSLTDASAAPGAHSYEKLLALSCSESEDGSRKMTKLLLHKDFSEIGKVWSDISFFPLKDRGAIAIALYFRSHNDEIIQQYQDQWIQEYPTYHILLKRLFWRCLSTANTTITDILQTIPSLTPLDVVVMYQALYLKAYTLPEPSKITSSPLSNNQTVFVQLLQLLSSQQGNHSANCKRWMTKVIKSAIQQKLALESMQPKVSVSHFLFLRNLESVLSEILLYCDTNSLNQSKLELGLIKLQQAVATNERNIKSQMSLKFI